MESALRYLLLVALCLTLSGCYIYRYPDGTLAFQLYKRSPAQLTNTQQPTYGKDFNPHQMPTAMPAAPVTTVSQ